MLHRVLQLGHVDVSRLSSKEVLNALLQRLRPLLRSLQGCLQLLDLPVAPLQTLLLAQACLSVCISCSTASSRNDAGCLCYIASLPAQAHTLLDAWEGQAAVRQVTKGGVVVRHDR